MAGRTGEVGPEGDPSHGSTPWGSAGQSESSDTGPLSPKLAHAPGDTPAHAAPAHRSAASLLGTWSVLHSMGGGRGGGMSSGRRNTSQEGQTGRPGSDWSACPCVRGSGPAPEPPTVPGKKHRDRKAAPPERGSTEVSAFEAPEGRPSGDRELTGRRPGQVALGTCCCLRKQEAQTEAHCAAVGAMSWVTTG